MTTTLLGQKVAFLFVAVRGYGTDISEKLSPYGPVTLCTNNSAVEQLLDVELTDWGCFWKDDVLYTVKVFTPDTPAGAKFLKRLAKAGTIQEVIEVPVDLVA